mmetsp:Transcript_91146/g.217408  ORF Transcript_91146/g.217408 Transcript_91146/m.217408 type:complete len:319 (+) Transcript_91146:2101-3057(+)
MGPLILEVAEPSIHLYVLISFEERDRLLHVRHLALCRQPLRRVRVRASNLRDPHRLAKHSVPVQVVLQAVGIAAKDVEADRINLAALAVVEELVEPVDRIEGPMVVHGWRDNRGNVVQFRDPLHILPVVCSPVRMEIGLLREVRLVEAEQSPAALRHAIRLCSSNGAIAPNHWVELDTRCVPHIQAGATLELVIPGGAPGDDVRKPREHLRGQHVVLNGNATLRRALRVAVLAVLLPWPAIGANVVLQRRLDASLLLCEESSLGRLKKNDPLAACGRLTIELCILEPNLFAAVAPHPGDGSCNNQDQEAQSSPGHRVD